MPADAFSPFFILFNWPNVIFSLKASAKPVPSATVYICSGVYSSPYKSISFCISLKAAPEELAPSKGSAHPPVVSITAVFAACDPTKWELHCHISDQSLMSLTLIGSAKPSFMLFIAVSKPKFVFSKPSMLNTPLWTQESSSVVAFTKSLTISNGV